LLANVATAFRLAEALCRSAKPDRFRSGPPSAAVRHAAFLREEDHGESCGFLSSGIAGKSLATFSLDPRV
jgi:hypothetical protein